MSNDLQTSITMDLKGNLERQSRRYGDAMKQMSDRGRRHMGMLGRVTANSTAMMSRGLDRMGNRYTGMLTGAAAVASVKKVGDIQERFTRLGIQANKSADDVEQLKREIYDASQLPNIRVDPSEITSAIEAIVEKTGDLDFARNNIENIGVAIQATGAAGGSIGEILAEFQKQGIKDPTAILQTLDTLNNQGKQGAFTLQNLAALGPRVVTAYTSLGRTGPQAMTEMGAALQMIRMGTGSSEQAATAWEALLRVMGDKEKVRQLQTLGGIQVFDADALKKGEEVLRPIHQIITDIIKASGGKKTNLSMVFDAEAMRSFNAAATEYQNSGALQTLDKMMEIQGDGTNTMNDAARAAVTFNSSMTNLGTAWQKFAESELAEPIQDVADALNSLEPGTLQDALGIAKNGAMVVGGALLARKAYRVGSGLFGKGGKDGRASGLLGNGSTPIPVYVVNNPMDLLPGRGGKGAKIFSKLKTSAGLLAGSNLKTIGTMGAGAMSTAGAAILAAGAAGYGAGTLINDQLIDDTALGNAIGEGLNRALAWLGNEESARAVAVMEKQQEVSGEIRIKIDQEGRASIAGMDRKSGPHLTADTGYSMGGL